MDRIVYVVTGYAGSYDDAREWPARVCATRAQAEAWAARMKQDTDRARGEHERVVERLEARDVWHVDEDEPESWPEEIRLLVAGMLDRHDALNRALYCLGPVVYSVEEAVEEAVQDTLTEAPATLKKTA